MTDEDIIRRRLMFDGDGTGEDRRLNDFLKNISKWLRTDHKTEEDGLIMFDSITAQLEFVKHSRRLAHLRRRQINKELQMYANLYDAMQSRINERKDEIETQKISLKNSKIIKHNQMQYSMLTKSMNQETPRTESLKYLDCLHSDIKDIEAQKEEVEEGLNDRRKLFKVLSLAANNLQELLSKEETDGGGRVTQKRK
ncbi:unnamed protein product [Ceutorhynchus assimilis]|uniref:THO complex subunit 7 homolog n=1 Tax=Ceutorhynchus assimilis TaxID=467358 RepID=A0A9P0GNS7_9CUCU|nr:unnamed protein product [Ceutorhynchus assimilis]